MALISPDLPLKTWIQKGLTNLGQLVSTSGPHPFSQLQHLFDLPATTFFVYLRLRSILSPLDITGHNTSLDSILKFYNTPNPAVKGIAWIYNLLTTISEDQTSSSISFWSSLTNSPPQPPLWHKALILPLRASHCISHWESTQKLFHKWYFTLARLSKIYPSASSQCWRNCMGKGTHSAHLVGVPWCPRLLARSLCPHFNGLQSPVTNTAAGPSSGSQYPKLAKKGHNCGDPHSNHSSFSISKKMEIIATALQIRCYHSVEHSLPNGSLLRQS